ncbi:MAG: acyltransferase [Burkholderiales bacterium]|nr:MAG: acyltransferase [Burkholderiales bacterium]
MSLLGKLVAITDRICGTHFALRSKRRYLAIDPSARLESGFRLELLATPQDRTYVRIGARSLVSARIVFESPQGAVEIGERVYFGGGTIICREKVTIGNDVTMAWGISLYDHDSQSLDWRRRAETVKHFYEKQGSASCYDEIDWTDVKSAPIVIEDKVWIGFDAVILKGVRVGEGAVIGARSVVARDVEPYTVVAGNPARVIKRIERS